MRIAPENRRAFAACRRAIGAVGFAWAALLPLRSWCQITPGQASTIRNAIGSRVEALTILGGDFALADGRYKFTGTTETRMQISKFGGDGDVGDPQPLGGLDIGWQPRLLGSVGYVDATSSTQTGPLKGGINRFRTFAVQFGAGARFWFTDRLSVAPTLTGMYGHTSNEFTPLGATAQTQLIAATRSGLVGWDESTWTVEPAIGLQYVVNWNRSLVTISSVGSLFRTESFSSSNANDIVDGNSGSWANKIDLDVPLGIQLAGHELRTGGYLSRTDLFNDLKDGIDTEHLYELHGRLVLDFLHQFWKVQWMGIGGSYLWGANFSGWTVGADVLLRF
jgi:hypothetical protein